MAISLYELSVPTFLQTVRSVAGFLRCAAKHCAETGSDPEDFVKARLIADMAPRECLHRGRRGGRVCGWRVALTL